MKKQHETPAERLKYIRKKARLTRQHIEKNYNLSEATLKSWENGVSPITEKGLQRCIEIYRKEGVVLTKEWVMEGTGVSPSLAVDIGRYLASDLQYSQREHGKIKEEPSSYAKNDNACILREATFFKDSYSDAVILMVNNDDMHPAYKAGDYVGGRFRYDTETIKTAIGHNCIIKLKDGENILRRLFKSKVENKYNLACINPETTSEEPIIFNAEIEAAAPIIWHRIPNI